MGLAFAASEVMERSLDFVVCFIHKSMRFHEILPAAPILDDRSEW